MINHFNLIVGEKNAEIWGHAMRYGTGTQYESWWY